MHLLCKASTGLQLKIPTFDGKTSWSTNFAQFQRITEVNGWSDENKAIALIASLRGDALNILEIMNAEEQRDYKSLKE